MPRPWVHALVSGGLATATYLVTRRRDLSAVVLFTGTLIDADHLVDYALVKGTGTRNWVVLPLHGWEYAVALGLAGLISPHARVAALSYLIHLTQDQIYNGLGPTWGYSFLWRLSRGFDVRRMHFKVTPHAWADRPVWQWFR